MSIASVVGRGFGSFGSVVFVPTRGYSIAASTADAQGCGCMEVLTATGVLEATVVLSEMTTLIATAEMTVIVCEDC